MDRCERTTEVYKNALLSSSITELLQGSLTVNGANQSSLGLKRFRQGSPGLLLNSLKLIGGQIVQKSSNKD